MSQANFMRNLRMTLPQYVTNITSFEDSVRILKNKGILTEADMKESHDANIKWLEAIKDIIEDRWQNGQIKDAEYGSVMTKLAQHPEGVISQYGETSAEDAANRLLNSVAHLGSEYDPGPGEDEDFERDYDMDYEEPNEPFDMAESLNEAKDPSSEGKWKTVTGKDLYNHFKEIDNLNDQEVLIGIDYEMQKNEELTKLEAQKIVIKNLKKIPNYYTNQDLSGVEGFEPDYIGGKSSNHDARQMQPLEKNLGNIVDKKMGMKPVKDVEKIKKDSDKGGETNKMEKGISLMSLIAKSVRGVQKMDATGEKMKKIVMKESRGEYTFVGTLNGAETEKVRTLLDRDPNINIEVDEEEGQRYDTYITSDVYTNKDIEHAVKMAKGEISSSTSPSSAGAGVAKFLTKERLMKMIKEELEEALGAYNSGDNVTNVTDENY